MSISENSRGILVRALMLSVLEGRNAKEEVHLSPEKVAIATRFLKRLGATSETTPFSSFLDGIEPKKEEAKS